METQSKLWDKNFSIMTVGSIVSMLGNAVAGFALGMLVLDYTDSVLLYSITIALYSLPKIIMPSIAGPYLDKFSRRKTMYILNFISAAIFAVITYLSIGNQFNYALVLAMCMVIGAIDSIYILSYESLYPLLVSESNYSKAYSIASMIKNISQVMVPVAVIIYASVGVAPLFAFNAVTFFVAAIFETMIRIDENQIKKLGSQYNIKIFVSDFKQGIRYVRQNKGLQYITLFYIVLSFSVYLGAVLMLPFFKNTEGLGLIKYLYVGGAAIVGRLIAGSYHYATKLKDSMKFKVAIVAFIVVAVLDGTYMLTNVPIMIGFMLISGILTITTYNIHMASTQKYVPNEMRARYNGTFQTLSVLGGSIGAVIGGALAEYIPIPYVIMGASVLVIIAVFAIMLRGRKEVKRIYNNEF